MIIVIYITYNRIQYAEFTIIIEIYLYYVPLWQPKVLYLINETTKEIEKNEIVFVI